MHGEMPIMVWCMVRCYHRATLATATTTIIIAATVTALPPAVPLPQQDGIMQDLARTVEAIGVWVRGNPREG